jgi:pyruvate,water dikinase
VIRLLMSDFPMGGGKGQERTDTKDLEKRFLDTFEGQRREFASKVLGLARESYRLRDDDNLYLGKIQARFEEALAEARRRVESGQCSMELPETEEQARQVMPKGHGWGKDDRPNGKQAAVKGWAASMGIARGKARVITSPDRLYEFQKGEVLVCDALDPNMTFVAPLASAIVERRGGMLVHGAIIAREYGIPCVTGIPDATRRFQDGDYLVVDGFRGEVSYGDR